MKLQKDIFGREIEIGDHIMYASTCWGRANMGFGIVVGYKEVPRWYGETPHYRLYVKRKRRHEVNWDRDKGYTYTDWYWHRTELITRHVVIVEKNDLNRHKYELEVNK